MTTWLQENGLQLAVFAVMIALAVDRWVHARTFTEQANAVAIKALEKDVETLDKYAHGVGQQGHSHDKQIAGLLRDIENGERAHVRCEDLIAENTRRIDELYRHKRGGS